MGDCIHCGHGCHCGHGGSCQSCDCMNCEHASDTGCQMARGLSINNNYSRGPKKRTSIGNSPRSRPKNKHKRRQTGVKIYKGQGRV